MPRGRDWAARTLAAEDFILLAAVALLPWAFGGVELWAYRAASSLLALAASVALIRGGWEGLGLFRGVRWLLPAFLLALWAAFQLAPVPPAVLRAVSPGADRIYRETFPGYPGNEPRDVVAAIEKRALDRVPEARGAAPPAGADEQFKPAPRGRWSGWRALSLEPDATLERLSWYLALLMAFLLARERTARSAHVARSYQMLCLALFTVIAVVGLLGKAIPNGRMLWIRPLPEGTVSFGPFTNPNSFAACMELAVPWLAGFAWERARRAGREALRNPEVILASGGAIVCLVAGIAAASKFAALLMGTTLTAMLIVAVGRGRRRLIAAAAAAAAWVAGGGIILARTALGERVMDFLHGSAGQLGTYDRILGWRSALRMFVDFPLTGVGFGAFRQVFPRYLPAGESEIWSQLHNDYLEVLVEGGVVAGVLLAWLVWAYGSKVVRAVREEEGPYGRFARMGLLLGLGALSLHGFVDFNHQIPATALLYVTAAALVLAGGRGVEGEP